MTTQSRHILILMFVALLVAGATSGCNTYRGFGKDVSNTGDAIQGNK